MFYLYLMVLYILFFFLKYIWLNKYIKKQIIIIINLEIFTLTKINYADQNENNKIVFFFIIMKQQTTNTFPKTNLTLARNKFIFP